MKNKDIIIETLTKLGGISSLKDIYSQIEVTYPDFPKKYKNIESFRSTIRDTLESNSSDSDNFTGKDDIFYIVHKKGDGIWGIREFNLIQEQELKDTEKKIHTAIRITQALFRKEVLKNFHSTCPLTGINIPSLLIASHIKPWSQSDNTERMDSNNGLLLSVHLDKLFDKYFISFEDSGDIIYRDQEIKNMIIKNFKFKGDKPRIPKEYLTEQRKKYLHHHREKFESLRK